MCIRDSRRGRGQGGGLRPRPIRTDPAALLNNLYDPDDQAQPEQTQAPAPDHVADPVHAEVCPARPDGGGEHETGADQGEALPALPAQPAQQVAEQAVAEGRGGGVPVSYTHLTLPTILRV